MTIARNFRRSAAFIGLAFASVAVLTACGTASTAPASNTAATAIGDYEGEVSILAWPGYVEDGSNDPTVDWVSAFEDETGCMVSSKSYGRRSAS
jgi:putative spermidine/putrescine transport system substrate-binding protein